MALKRPKGPAGTLLVLEHVSKILKDNPLRDPHVRKLGVWLPPQYDEGGRRRFPVLYDLVGFTGSGLSHTNWKPFGDNVPERAARLIREGRMGPAIIVFPDCFTALGGNQYVNSSAIGDYADYLTREIVPFVDREFRTMPNREHRGCFGKSSGGYGAILHGMKYARTWGAVADQSRREIPRQPEVALRHLHRLRLARPVPYPVRIAHPVRAPRRGWNPAPLRGIRRRPLRRRLPHGCEPAVPLQGAEALRAAAKASGYLTRPSAFIVSCTLGRAAMRAWKALRFGHLVRSILCKPVQLRIVNR